MQANTNPARRRNACSRVLITLGAMVGLALSPAIATAAPSSSSQNPNSRTAESSTVVINSDQLVTRGSVNCPEGSRAIAGGSFGDRDSGSGPVIGFLLSESGPTPTGDGWQITVLNPDRLQSIVYANVLCDSGVRDYQLVDGAPARVAPSTYKQANATCTDGRQALSGGWRTDRPEDVAGSQSLPLPSEPGTTWLNGARNFGTSDVNITPVTVCARVDNWTQAFSDRVRVEPGRKAQSHMGCPAGLRLAGGGFHTDTVNMMAVWSFPQDDLSEWSVRVRSEDPQPRQHYAVAVCTS